jgi:hypothetical protein
MESLLEIIKEYLGEAVVAIVTGLVAYLSGKKKAEVELRSSEGEALKTMQEAYDKFTTDSLKKYQELYEELHEVKEMLKIVKKELEDCRNGVLAPR